MHETWAETLKAIVDRPMALAEIYSGVRRRRNLTPRDLEPWEGDKQPRYQCWCRSELAKLVKRGEVRHLARGRYAPN
jgi:hypothetical protein